MIVGSIKSIFPRTHPRQGNALYRIRLSVFFNWNTAHNQFKLQQLAYFEFYNTCCDSHNSKNADLDREGQYNF